MLITSPLTFSKMTIHITTNTASVSFTMNFRVNQTTVTQTLVISAGITGVFTDTTHSDSAVAGNVANYQMLLGAGSGIVIYTATSVLANGTASVFQTTNQGAGGFQVAGMFIPLGGQGLIATSITTATEVRAQGVIRYPGIFKNMATSVAVSGSLGGTQTFVFRKNGVTGNQTITTSPSTNGFFQDTTHTDPVVAGDKVCVECTATASGGAPQIGVVQCEFSGGSDYLWSAQQGGINVGVLTGGTVYYDGFESPLTQPPTTESLVQLPMNLPSAFKDLWVYVFFNSCTLQSSVTLRKNGVSTAMSLPITASTSGLFEDSLDGPVTFNPADLCNMQYTPGGTGNFQIIGLGIGIPLLYPGFMGSIVCIPTPKVNTLR